MIKEMYYCIVLHHPHQPWKLGAELLTLVLSTAWWLGVIAAIVVIVRELS